MKKVIILATILLGATLIATNRPAADMSHEGKGKMQKSAEDMSQQGHDKMQKSAPGTFEHQMVDKNVRAEFKIMSLESMNMKDSNGATHHIMVKLFDDKMNHPINDAVGKVKVVGVDKKEQVSGLKNYSGIIAGNFTFKEKGKYGVICLVKVKDKKHLFKFWYPHE
jgi:hypothetical protein